MGSVIPVLDSLASAGIRDPGDNANRSRKNACFP